MTFLKYLRGKKPLSLPGQRITALADKKNWNPSETKPLLIRLLSFAA
jgi:hypothetical protein